MTHASLPMSLRGHGVEHLWGLLLITKRFPWALILSQNPCSAVLSVCLSVTPTHAAGHRLAMQCISALQ